MQITICDICGKKIGKVNGKDDRYTFCVSHEPDSDKISPFAKLLTHGEACGECAKKIANYIVQGCQDLRWEGERIFTYTCMDGEKIMCNNLAALNMLERIDKHMVKVVEAKDDNAEPQHVIPTNTEKPRRGACKRSHGDQEEQ